MRKSKTPIKPGNHGTMNGYAYHRCRCLKCITFAAKRRKEYRSKHIETRRIQERESQRRLMTNPTYREKVNKRQMELYYAMLKNPDTAREFRIKQKQSYLKNKDKIRTATNNKRKRDKDHLIALLGGKCIVCGITNPILLEFHHIDPTHKDFDISKGLSGNWESSELLEKEAKKCELLCANCHRLKTHQP